MILIDKLKFIAIAAITVLVLLAVMPAGVVATTTIFEDDFETGNLDKWDNTGGIVVVSSAPAPAPPWGGYFAMFSNNDSINRSWITARIDTTCMKNICLSFARRTFHLDGAENEFFVIQFYNGTDWQLINGYSDNLPWSTISYCPLPATADDNPDFAIRFALVNADSCEFAFLDNVTVTGEPILPALEVNKTVYDPENETWVKELTAKINDTLTFRSIITNTGNVNLSYIRFWDILDCSLKYQGRSLKIDNESTRFCDPWMFRFKPRVLHHPDEPWCLDNPVQTLFTELCPPCDKQRLLVDWDDTNHDGNISVCDQIELVESGVYESERLGLDVNFVDDGVWYHVDRVPYTLNLYNGSWSPYEKYFDSALNWDDPDMNLSDPINSTWLEVCCCKDQYTLIEWQDDTCEPGVLSQGDFVTLRNERTGEEITGEVDTEVVIDLVASIEYEMDRGLDNYALGDPLARILELFILEPNQTITIEYNATVVKCGVDNNTFVVKGIGCGDNWTYSDPAVVTITVPCPSGDAADGTPVIKDLFACDEPVYALAHDFAPNKSVDIYITPVRTWTFGDNISDYAIVGPVPVVTDPNGSIGINPKVLMWPDPVPGLYHMVFDDPDGIYEPGVDLYDFFEVRCVAVPLITPLGLVALVGLLGVIATSTLVRRRRR